MGEILLGGLVPVGSDVETTIVGNIRICEDGVDVGVTSSAVQAEINAQINRTKIHMRFIR